MALTQELNYHRARGGYDIDTRYPAIELGEDNSMARTQLG